MSTNVVVPVAILGLLLASCGGDTPGADAAGSPAMAAPARTVHITTPAPGETVQGPAVRVVMAADGFRVVAAGDTSSNSGHLHLFLDRDLSAPGVPIPVEPGFVVHMGTGASEYTFDSVAPGDHRLIAVVGDAVHIPLEPWVVDTIRFTVR